LNQATKLKGDIDKEFAYDDKASSTSNGSPAFAAIEFGSGALAGHFYKDDIRIGSCNGKGG